MTQTITRNERSQQAQSNEGSPKTCCSLVHCNRLRGDIVNLKPHNGDISPSSGVVAAN